MTELEFRLAVWRHIVAIVKALSLYWFGKYIRIEEDVEWRDRRHGPRGDWPGRAA